MVTYILWKIYTDLRMYCSCAMAEAVSWRPLTTQARVRSEVSACESHGEQSSNGGGFSSSNSVYTCQYHAINTSYSTSPTSCSYQKDKRANPGNLPKRNALPEIGKH